MKSFKFQIGDRVLYKEGYWGIGTIIGFYNKYYKVEWSLVGRDFEVNSEKYLILIPSAIDKLKDVL